MFNLMFSTFVVTLSAGGATQYGLAMSRGGHSADGVAPRIVDLLTLAAVVAITVQVIWHLPSWPGMVMLFTALALVIVNSVLRRRRGE